MEGRRRLVHHEEMEEVKKGPWKPEEDQVLKNHVRKYGPRDWSSIRSKGLLRRTGKSCRLRWVNKLRPNLKTGVKFSGEEERTVIELQAELGNKWATIATYLPGRTDNDVKNFWSSRQKRLARMLHNTPPPRPPPPPPPPPPRSSSSSSSTKPPRKNTTIPHQLHSPISYLDIPTLEAPKFSSSPEEPPEMANPPSSSLDKSELIKIEPFAYPPPLVYKPDQLRLSYGPPANEPAVTPSHHHEQQQQQQHEHLFPQVPRPDFPLPLESQEDIITQLGEPNFLDEFENPGGPALGPDIGSFIDRFPPIDIFDHIPSPSEWL